MSAAKTEIKAGTGEVVQVIGPVVDIKFADGECAFHL